MLDLPGDANRAFFDRLVTGDYHGLLQQIRSRLDSAAPTAAGLRDVYLETVYPVMAEINTRYRSGRLSDQEFQIASITAARTETVLYTHLPVASVRRGQAVASCLPGRTQSIGSYLVSDLLELEGWDVPVLPVLADGTEILGLLSQLHPFLLVLSVEPGDDPAEAVRFVRLVLDRLTLPTLHVILLTGNPAAAEALPREIAGTCTIVQDPGSLLRAASAFWEGEGRPYALGLSFPTIATAEEIASEGFGAKDEGQAVVPGFAAGPMDVLGSLADLTLDAITAYRQVVRRNRELESANSRLLDMTETDYLTGIRNRRFAYNQLDSFVSYKKRNPSFTFSAIMFDLDNFKQINDIYGHSAGDSVLVAVARRVRESLRKEDLFARLGGDEFLVTLFNHGVDDALSVAEKLRRAIEGIDFRGMKFPGNGKMSGSFGVTQLADGDDTSRISSRVDQAMYAAKAAGRNRTVVL